MLDAASMAARHARAHSRSELETDELLAHGLVHMLLVLGEAASRVGEEERRLHPGIPWRQVVGLRNRLVHGYDDIDPDTVWSVLTKDLPSLITELERILATRE